MTEWLLVLAGVGLTIGTAVFVAAEFAFVALDKTTVQKAIEQGDTAAKPVLASLRHLSTQLSASQVGITVTTLVLGYLAQPSVGKLLRTPLNAVGVPSSAVEPSATAVALVLATLFSMAFGELLPQFLGISAPLRDSQVRRAARACLLRGHQATHHRAQRLSEPGAQGFRHHPAGRAVRGTNPPGARVADPAIGRRGHSRRRHRAARHPITGLR